MQSATADSSTVGSKGKKTKKKKRRKLSGIQMSHVAKLPAMMEGKGTDTISSTGKLTIIPTCETRIRPPPPGEEAPAVVPKKPFVKPRRVHFLGLNATSLLVAHSFASLTSRPPMTFLMTERENKRWHAEGEILIMLRDGEAEAQIGFDAEYTTMTQTQHATQRPLSATSVLAGDNGWVIEQLVVSTPGYKTVEALMQVRDRLRPTSSILFLQDVMGVKEEVDEMVFPDPATRPRYMFGFSHHGVTQHPRRFFAIKHYREGDMRLSIEPSRDYTFSDNAEQLLYKHTRSPRLKATGLYHSHFYVEKMRDLAIESVLGALSAVFDAKAGTLLHNFNVYQTADQMMGEICRVVLALPEIQGQLQSAKKVFQPEYLLNAMFGKAALFKNEYHHLAQTVRAGERTDTEYMTGYFLKRAEKLGIECPVNLAMMRMVNAKQKINQWQVRGDVPFEYKVKTVEPGK